MRLTKSIPKAAKPIVISLVTGVLAVDGQKYNVRMSERIRSDHPLARKYPHLFVADGLTDQEFHAARQAMLAKRDAAA